MAFSTWHAFGSEAEEYVHRYRVWFAILGSVLIVLGILAVLASTATTYLSMLLLASILLLDGILHVVASFSARNWSGSLLVLLTGLLYLVASVLTFRHPVSAALALTLLISALLLTGGLFRIIGGVWYRYPQWGWVVLSGVVSLLLGLMLWNSWPASGLWFIGLCVGVDLIVDGLAWVALSLSEPNIELFERARTPQST
jgi:uncharacterized membrane protein HdeD (DUF308 family)